MREILQSLGDKMTDKELDEMMAAASSDREGFINYEGRHLYLSQDLCSWRVQCIAGLKAVNASTHTIF